MISSVLTAESQYYAQESSISSANAATTDSIQHSYQNRAIQIESIIAADRTAKDAYHTYVVSNDPTLNLSDKQVHTITWSGGKLPLPTQEQADKASQLAMQYLAANKLCKDIVSKESRIVYPDFVHRITFNLGDCE